MLAAKQRAQARWQQSGELCVVLGIDPHLRLLREQPLQDLALADDEIQRRRFFRQPGGLIHAQIGLCAIGHQDHHPAHAAGDQRIASGDGQAHGIGEAAWLGQ